MTLAPQNRRRALGALALVPLMGLTLAACSTVANMAASGAPESEDAIYATSPANIA